MLIFFLIKTWTQRMTAAQVASRYIDCEKQFVPECLRRMALTHSTPWCCPTIQSAYRPTDCTVKQHHKYVRPHK